MQFERDRLGRDRELLRDEQQVVGTDQHDALAVVARVAGVDHGRAATATRTRREHHGDEQGPQQRAEEVGHHERPGSGRRTGATGRYTGGGEARVPPRRPGLDRKVSTDRN